MRIFTWMLAFCVLLVAGYYIWGYTGKDYSSLHVPAVPVNIITDSTDKGKGNLLAIQPYLTIADYCDQQHFHDALSVYFKKAQAAGLLRPNTIAVLPENIGSWLAFANEKTRIYEADSMRQAVSTIANSNIFVFIRNLLLTPADDKIKHAFVYMKAASMAKIYTAVFSSLAKEFNVTIAAGSIILPQPSLDARGRIHIKKGDLYYSAFVFDPDGRIQGRPVLQMLPEYNSNPVDGADSNQYTIAQTPAGDVVITTGEEPELKAGAKGKKGGLKAVIIFSGTDRIWNAVWKGPGGFMIPLSAVENNIDPATQAASRSVIPQSANKPATGTPTVMENRFAGSLWEIGFTDGLLVGQKDSLLVFDPVRHQGSIVNKWIY